VALFHTLSYWYRDITSQDVSSNAVTSPTVCRPTIRQMLIVMQTFRLE